MKNLDSKHSDALIAVTGAHVLVVTSAEGRNRRRVYLQLSSAQKAVDRAVMAGHTASIALCQLVPVGGECE